MKRAGFFFALLLLPWCAGAHVGSPNVFYQGEAGPYPLRVVVRPPGIVPGLAEISIRVEGSDVRRVTALPVFWNAGRKGAPPPDEAKPVRGETNLFATTLWLMKSGAYSVDVSVEGGRGAGTVAVPVNSLAISRRPMAPWFGSMLTMIGLVLFVAAVRIAGATFGEAIVAPNDPLTAVDRRRSHFAMALAVPLFALLLAGGKSWWDREDRSYRNNRLYKPLPVSATVRQEGSQNLLRIEVERSPHRRSEWRPLIPDHGKMMHLFLVREPGLDAFAHLHPVPRGGQTFDVALPPLPSGSYSVYADVTHEDGFAQTLVANAHLPEAVVRSGEGIVLAPDPDDSWHVETNAHAKNEDGSSPRNVVFRLPGDRTMVWENEAPLRENREASLRFKILDAKGEPVPLEPYMGMRAHAAIRHMDGSVFAHLHPVGSISMASQEFFAREAMDGGGGRARAETVATAAPADHSHHFAMSKTVEDVSFPYEFPKAGPYRIWVQMKCEGQVVTGVFDAEVVSGGNGGRRAFGSLAR
jgi:hypothetical protein